MDLVFSSKLVMLAAAFMSGFLCFSKIDPVLAMLVSHVILLFPVVQAVKRKE